MKIVFVILHYLVDEETQKCVEYIRKNIDTETYQILIVDNASPNGSGQRLQKVYQSATDVTLLLNEKNLGFAKGNNVGYRYAKSRWSPEFVVLMNNDVYLLEKFLVSKLEEEFMRSQFYVLGPMIMTRDGRCDINPDNAIFRTKADIEREIHKNKRVYRRYRYRYASLFYRLTPVLDAILNKSRPRTYKEYLERQEDVKLHGCFLVFSDNYMREYDGLDESTFLYWEEEFLYKHMMTNHKKTVYAPNILVYHREDAATDSMENRERERMMFRCEHYISSLEKLKELYEYYEEIQGE